MTLKNNRAPLCCYFKLSTTLRSHQWIQTWGTIRTLPIWVKIDVLSRVTLKFDRRPRKTIWHIFCAASSFAPQFVAINQFKLELPSGNAQIRKKNDFFVKCDLEIWRVTLKNNRAPLQCHIKLCPSFHCHMWVTIRKRLYWVLTSVTLIFDLWPWLLHGHHFCLC